MRLLIIDTSGPMGFCALIEDNRLEWSFECAARELVEQLAQKNPHYNQIAVGIGPGSFTGTRIGVMAAKTLSFATKAPIRTFNSLELRNPNLSGTLVRDARSNLYYTLDGLVDQLPKDAIDVDRYPPNLTHLTCHLSSPKTESEVEVLYLKNP